jgi:hypothetical protein
MPRAPAFVAHAKTAVVEEARERTPSLQAVVDRLRDRCFRREFLTVGSQPSSSSSEHVVNALHRFERDPGLQQLGEFEVLATSVGPAHSFDYLARLATMT